MRNGSKGLMQIVVTLLQEREEALEGTCFEGLELRLVCATDPSPSAGLA
jgi:hypothetical protein